MHCLHICLMRCDSTSALSPYRFGQMRAYARLSSLALVVLSGCIRATPTQRPTVPVSLTDTLIGLALDNVADPKAARPLLVYSNAAKIPVVIFGPERLHSLMRAAPEVDSALATRVLGWQAPQHWQGVLSLPWPVRWVNDSLFHYWMRSAQGYREFRRLEAGHATIVSVAQPVIDTTRWVAVVYVESLCGPFCDSGRAFVFVRDSEHRWVLRRVALRWQS